MTERAPTSHWMSGGASTPLLVFAYAAVATIIAGSAAPAAGIAVLALGVVTVLGLGLVEERRSDAGAASVGAASETVGGYSFGPRHTTRSYLEEARRRAGGAPALAAGAPPANGGENAYSDGGLGAAPAAGSPDVTSEPAFAPLSAGSPSP